MNHIDSVTLEAADPAAAEAFYAQAFDGLGGRLAIRAASSVDARADGFRGFTLSLVVAQPSTVDALVGAAVDAGATTLKDPKKSFWGYGGVVRAPDGAIWKIATSTKKDKASATPASRAIDDVVLLLGVADVKASKQLYADRGFAVAKSFGGKYAEFQAPAGSIKLALYGRRALAKDAGVPEEGIGSHRIIINNQGGAFTDPDGFAWAV
jgi:predicted lactoylglutathione lyase